MQEAPRRKPLEVLTRPIWFAPLLLLLSGALSYIYADRNMPAPDEGALLTAAVKILHGGVFYRDIDAYAFPGATYLVAGAMSVFGEHLAVARTVAGIFYCTMTLGVYASALTLIDQRRAALCGLSLLSLKFFAYPIYSMISYPDPSIAAAVVALALFLRHPFHGASMRLFWVGVLAGLSIVTKQSTGIYVAGVFGLVLCFPGFAHGPTRRSARLGEVATYMAGLILVIGSMSAYFASHGVFGDMVYSGLLRPFSGYLPTSGISFLPPFEWWNFGELESQRTVYMSLRYQELITGEALPRQAIQGFYWLIGELASRLLYNAIPIVFAICAWLWLRAFREPLSSEDGDQAIALALGRFFTAAGVCLAITVSAFPRADFTHIITIYPAVVLILFALCRPSLLGYGWTQQSRLTSKTQSRRLRFETAFVALLLVTTMFLSVRYDETLTHRLSVDRAELWVRPEDAWNESLIETIRKYVPHGEPLFIYGHEAQWYFLSDRYSPRPFSQLYPGMTGDQTGQELALLIRKIKPRLIVQGVLVWKGVPPLPDYTWKLQRTIQRLYRSAPRAIREPPPEWVVTVWRTRF